MALQLLVYLERKCENLQMIFATVLDKKIRYAEELI